MIGAYRLLQDSGIEVLDKKLFVDLMLALPARAGLKAVAARMHAASLSELPFDPNVPAKKATIERIRKYLIDDLDRTAALMTQREVVEDLRLRKVAIDSGVIGHEVFSMTNAGIGLRMVLDRMTEPPHKRDGDQWREGIFSVDVPLIDTMGPVSREFAQQVSAGTFAVQDAEITRRPEALGRLVRIGTNYFKPGAGGLHSLDGPGFYQSDDERVLIDLDVASFYPSLIVKWGIAPRHLDEGDFGNAVGTLMSERLAVKAKYAATKAPELKLQDTRLKVTVNSIYGLLNNPGSPVYDPHAAMSVTCTGQAFLLALIEGMPQGVDVIMANTDGLIVLADRNAVPALEAWMRRWSEASRMTLESAQILRYWRKDVSNYLIEAGNNIIKVKGVFAADATIAKVGGSRIIRQAVQNFLLRDIPVEQTVMDEKAPFTDFVVVREWGRGFTVDGDALGKIARFYWSNAPGLPVIRARSTREGVADSVVSDRRAALAIELPAGVPGDLDRSVYANEAQALVDMIGVPAQVCRNRIARILEDRGIPICFADKPVSESMGGDYAGSDICVKLGKPHGLALIPEIDTVGLDVLLLTNTGEALVRIEQIPEATLKVLKKTKLGRFSGKPAIDAVNGSVEMEMVEVAL